MSVIPGFIFIGVTHQCVHIVHKPIARNQYELITLHMGADVMVAVKAEMHEAASTRALVDTINGVEAAFRERFPQTQWVFFEPDVR